MKKSEFAALIIKKLQHIPTQGQKQAITLFADYMCCREKEAVMLLKGYAGTGKTSLVSAFVRALGEVKIKTVLLAPTGRAAKVLGNYSSRQAYTIHKEIYRIKPDKEGNERLVLRENEHQNTIFFVDEASMIYDVQPLQNAMLLFQDTNLLYNLFSYVEQGKNCRLVFIGDTAQLPPVGLQYSPALDADFLKDNFSKLVFDCELKEVVRQVKKSGILYNATKIRALLGKHSSEEYKFVLDKFDDTVSVATNDLLDALEQAYQKYDYENVVAVTRSNKQANMLNQAIRNRILYRESDLEKGDSMISLKNNYFWLSQDAETKFIANGDMLEIVHVSQIEERYGFRFADVKVRFPDYEMDDIKLKLILDTLYVESAAMTNESRTQLYTEVCLDYAHIHPPKKRSAAIKKDPYLNALQVKFAYAQTCHKTQGGQWDI
ncbi:MAG: tRNA (adenosine(37)-N6)-threonylcarbamoyltransferase complex ATPase subunit type 1 TsaE, partial [Bacteroidales bacterium]|nr:tRNA (adenosine(37)-N6)-threonylcarbamoyltransferase complex ATPase subunit type 1 TsaE [Bacteroidales bacterium]